MEGQGTAVARFFWSGCSRIVAEKHGAARRATVLDNTGGGGLQRENHPFKMSPLNLQHHRQPPPSPPPPPPPPSPTSTSTGALPTFSSRLQPHPTSRDRARGPPSRTATGFFHPSHFYIHLNPSILNDGYFLRATVWIFIPSSKEEPCIEGTGGGGGATREYFHGGRLPPFNETTSCFASYTRRERNPPRNLSTNSFPSDLYLDARM